MNQPSHSIKPPWAHALPLCTALIMPAGEVFTTSAGNAEGMGLRHGRPE